MEVEMTEWFRPFLDPLFYRNGTHATIAPHPGRSLMFDVLQGFQRCSVGVCLVQETSLAQF
jgi:hypothetical protein